MKKIVKAEIYFDGEYYCARCLDFDVFTQGKTLDELILNLKEAIQLHLEDDSTALAEFAPNPALLTVMDLGEIYA
ncbi:MAG: type II toxin-antitoxin system HicB family antitoxin [Thermodesulfobacteriota bacterium]